MNVMKLAVNTNTNAKALYALYSAPNSISHSEVDERTGDEC
jgi:hypothetical protein